MGTSSVVGSSLRVLPPVIRDAPPAVPVPTVPKDNATGVRADGATDGHLLRITV